jgi:hypothetical protein
MGRARGLEKRGKPISVSFLLKMIEQDLEVDVVVRVSLHENRNRKVVDGCVMSGSLQKVSESLPVCNGLREEGAS